MARRLPRSAVDTTVLVNFFTGGANDPPERLPHSTWVMRAAAAETFELVVPSICIAELAGAGAVRGEHLPAEVRRERWKRVREWIYGSGFLIVDIDARVALKAAELAVKHQLKGPDAAIVAAAQMAAATTLYSWDHDQLKLGDRIDGLVIREPEAAEDLQDKLDLP